MNMHSENKVFNLFNIIDKQTKIINIGGNFVKYTECSTVMCDEKSTKIEAKWIFDEQRRPIHYEDSTGFESWYEYDGEDYTIHQKQPNGFETWLHLETDVEIAHYKDSDGFETLINYKQNE